MSNKRYDQNATEPMPDEMILPNDAEIIPPSWSETESSPDINFILQAVEAAKTAGIEPESILTIDELHAYQEYKVEHPYELPPGHYDNLVDAIDPAFVGRLGADIIQWVRWDEETRKDWSARDKEGIRLLGVSDQPLSKAIFEGASQVVHPILADAVISFHSRMIAELWPPEGPVKAVVMGDPTSEINGQCERVQDYMNYQYTEDMPGGFEEEDALLFRLPLSGSAFKKTYFDPLCRKPVSRMVSAEDFIVPFSATDLETCHRYTYRYREMHNVAMKKAANGYYSKSARLTPPRTEQYDYPEVKEEIDHTEGKRPSGTGEDSRHTFLEMVVDLDIPGLEDIDPITNEPTGIALPYLVIVSRDDQSVLRIQRNYEPEDQDKKRIVEFTHYKLLPGLGFYGYGLLHFIGGLAFSASGAVNALLDAAGFANLPAGFRTREARMKGDQPPLKFGEWREIDCSAEDINKAFFKLPYDEPSDVLFELLKYLDEKAGQFLGPGADVLTGDAPNNAPVGTTLALIEQGSKTFTSVHLRLHKAHKQEFRKVARLNSMYIPEGGYPYYVKGASREIFATDFDERVDVIPVSDPSLISNTQRIHQAQAVLDLAEKHPEEVSIVEAIRLMLTAIRVPNVDELMSSNQGYKDMQTKLAQLDIAKTQAEIAKTQAETEKVKAERTEAAIKGMFAAFQSAGLALDPILATIADSIFRSGGGQDYNGAPLVDQSSYPAQPDQTTFGPLQRAQGIQQLQQLKQPQQPGQPGQVVPFPQQQNTHPNFPANPGDATKGSQPFQPPQPQSPEQGAVVGVNAGIETQQNEGVNPKTIQDYSDHIHKE